MSCDFSPLCFADVQIGFEESTYTASESDMSVSICAELKEGTLGIPVSISFSTSVPNPQGTYMHVYVHNYIYMWCTHQKNQSRLNTGVTIALPQHVAYNISRWHHFDN